MSKKTDAQFISHAPNYYVGGIYIEEMDEWMGRFHTTAEELLSYAENDVQTVAEYEVVLSLLSSQQTYKFWWDKVRRENKNKK